MNSLGFASATRVFGYVKQFVKNLKTVVKNKKYRFFVAKEIVTIDSLPR